MMKCLLNTMDIIINIIAIVSVIVTVIVNVEQSLALIHLADFPQYSLTMFGPRLPSFAFSACHYAAPRMMSAGSAHGLNARQRVANRSSDSCPQLTAPICGLGEET